MAMRESTSYINKMGKATEETYLMQEQLINCYKNVLEKKEEMKRSFLRPGIKNLK